MGRRRPALIDASFLPRARAGDLDGGLARLVGAVDAEIDRRVAEGARRAWLDEHIGPAPTGPGLVLRPATLDVELPETAGVMGDNTLVVVHAEALPAGTSAGGTATSRLLEASRRAWGLDPTWTVAFVGLDEGVVHVEPPAAMVAGGVWPLTERVRGGEVDAAAARALQAVARAVAAKQEELDWRAEREAERQAAVVDAAAAAAAEEAAAEARRAARRDVATKVAVGVGATSVPVGLGAWGLAMVAMARRRFQRRASEREAQLTQARNNLVDLQLDVETREKLVQLKLKGPVTLARLDDVGDAVATLHAGLAALEAQLAAARAAAPGALATPGAWRRLAARLEAELEIDTGEAQARLFDGPTRVLRVRPAEFMAELDAAFADARAGWDRILDATEAAGRSARDDLPADDLARMRAQLSDAGLPASWLDTHPLVPSPEATWRRLDGLRVADPVAYLDALDDAIAEDDELECIVVELAGWRAEGNASWEAAGRATLGGLTTRFGAPEVDPEVHRARLAADRKALDSALDSGADLAAVRVHGQALVGGCAVLVDLVAEIRDAVRTGRARLDEAAAEAARLDEGREAQLQALAALLADFTPDQLADARREAGEAGEDADEARAALAEAEARWAEGRHVEAVRAAAEAVAELAQAREDLEELERHLASARAVRARADEVLAALDQRRAQVSTGYGAEVDLQAVDAELAEVRQAWAQPGNWVERLARVEAASEALSREVARADAARRLAAERAQRAREARASAERRASTSFSSSSSSTSYRSTGSRSSSFSSSSSSGRSFSSGGRSSGRSFSSGGRSSGRKW